jgi:hypothetical protein
MTAEGDAKARYEAGRSAHAKVAAALERRARTIGSARLAVAAAAAGLVGGIVWGGFGTVAWLALGALGVLFVALVVAHAQAEASRERALAAVRYHERGLARLAHAWDELPHRSSRFGSKEHPFATDLDVFGRASLMQLVDATETRMGEEKLASWLSASAPESWPQEVFTRAEAARDLAPRAEFREALATAAGLLANEKPAPAGVVAWAEKNDRLPLAFGVLAWVLPVSLLGLFVVSLFFEAPARWRIAAVLLEIAIGLALGARHNALLVQMSAQHEGATRWRATLAVIEHEPFLAPRLTTLKGRLRERGRPASEEMAALERIVGYVDARQNELFRFFIGPLLMWDVHCAMALSRWRRRAGARLGGWFDALAEVEALASLGGFAFEHPAFAWPDLSPVPLLEAEGLGHPLIAAERRVGNDVRLPSGGLAIVVTGSNMSGKSTLLRAIGVNAVLAFAGAPVCARSMRIGALRVSTSMRVDDSLSQGVSHFYAELQRLKHVVDEARTHDRAAVLFLLDEILHGTNSRERVLGAIAIVRDLVAHGALGAVSTHDLGITALERELPGQVSNVHFEEQVNGRTMTFDYVLRPGVVQTSNALRLMRAIGIEVADEG